MKDIIFYTFAWSLMIVALVLFIGQLYNVFTTNYNKLIDEITSYTIIMILCNTLAFFVYLIFGIVWDKNDFMLINICFFLILELGIFVKKVVLNKGDK